MNRKLDPAAIRVERGSDYPPPFDAPCRDIERKRLGDAAGLSQFGFPATVATTRTST
jgi:uncharacterized cupin superfamily protein